MIDQHLHSNFSPDSQVDIKDYIEMMKHLGNDYLNVTDHFDYLDKLKKYDGYDYIENIRAQFKYISELEDEVYAGVEVGYNKTLQTTIESLLAELNFSIVLLSIHDNDDLEVRYCRALDYNISPNEVAKIYFSQMYEAVTSGVDFDILTHIGYIFRYCRGQIDYMEFMDDIKKVLEELVKTERILEINTGCFRVGTYDANDFYSKVLKIYTELGGYKVSLGSDAHSVADYCYQFEEAKEFLKSNGINEVTLVKNRKHTQVKI